MSEGGHYIHPLAGNHRPPLPPTGSKLEPSLVSQNAPGQERTSEIFLTRYPSHLKYSDQYSCNQMSEELMNGIHAALVCQLLWKGRTAWSSWWGFKPLLQNTWPIFKRALLPISCYQCYSQETEKGENVISFKFWIWGHAREKVSCYLLLSNTPCRDFVLVKRPPFVYSTFFCLSKFELIFYFLLLRFCARCPPQFPQEKRRGSKSEVT